MFSNIGNSGGRGGGGLDDLLKRKSLGVESGGGCKTKNLLWGAYGNFVEQHISCKIAYDENFNKF